MSSPYYPQNYPNQTECIYTVSTENGLRIVIEFQDFDLESGYDFLYVDDDRFTGSIVPESVISSDRNVTIRFRSDEFVDGRGFLLTLTTLDISGS